jgi:hypothetical protein
MIVLNCLKSLKTMYRICTIIMFSLMLFMIAALGPHVAVSQIAFAITA